LIADDRGVSEILGYTVLVAVVSIAAVGLMSAGMGTLQTTERNMELAGCAGALESFAHAASVAVQTGNTFYAVHEMSVPSNYELVVLDRNDDVSAFKVYQGNTLLTSLRMGSVSLRSPFRSVTFAGGAVTSNDAGEIEERQSPYLYAVEMPSGKKAIYVTVIAVSCDTFARGTGSVGLGVKCGYVTPVKYSIGDGSTVTIEVAGCDGAGWERPLKEAGFSVQYEDGILKASSGSVSEVYVTDATVDVKPI
jgi:hypothetical protein